MEFLNGNRSGDGVLLLSSEREISRDNLWAIRLLIGIVFINGLVNGSTGGGTVVVGMGVGAVALYAAALWLASAPIDSGSDGADERATAA